LDGCVENGHKHEKWDFPQQIEWPSNENGSLASSSLFGMAL
jgi:hypothetical protein